MLEWDDLRYVLAIWRAGTMNGAARILKVNQTTVARRLGVVEERLGALLFDRTPDGFRLTERGRKIVPLATQMEEAALLLERAVAGSDDQRAGTVRLACSETLAVGFVGATLADFRAANPDIALEVVTGISPLNLLRREADVALRTVKPTQSDLIARKLADVNWYLYRRGDAVQAAHAADACPVIGYEGELAEMLASQWLNQHVAAERVVMRCNSILTAQVAAGAGLGMAALPAFLADDDPALALVLPEPISTNSLWLAVHVDLQHQVRVRALMDFLVERFARAARRFAGTARS